MSGTGSSRSDHRNHHVGRWVLALGVVGGAVLPARLTAAWYTTKSSALPTTGSHAGPLAFVGLALTVVGLTPVRLGRPSEQSAN